MFSYCPLIAVPVMVHWKIAVLQGLVSHVIDLVPPLVSSIVFVVDIDAPMLAVSLI